VRRIICRVAYDGTAYSGWQEQPTAVTIEGELNKALQSLTGEEIHVIGASRTDAGVHALGNICVFDTDSTIPPERFYKAMNVRLPADIRVVESGEVAVDFHPRHQRTEKTYCYTIWNGDTENPLWNRYSMHRYGEMDLDGMELAGKHLVGTHDFKAFCSARTSAETTVRTIYDVTVQRSVEKPELIYIRVTGNGFLYNMVRIIAGTLVEIGAGLRNRESVLYALREKDRTLAGPTAPAKGLCLEEIRYPDAFFPTIRAKL